jgi:hypothetical protein
MISTAHQTHIGWGQHKGRRTFERPRSRWGILLKCTIKKYDVDVWIELICLSMDQMNTVMNLRVQ